MATADSLSATGGHADRIRLSFAPPVADLRVGVDRLAAAWSAREHPAGAPAPEAEDARIP